MKTFIDFLHTITPLPQECTNDLINEITKISLLKDEHIKEGSEYADSFYFVVEGIVRIYYLKDGKEITDWFASKNQVIGSIMRIYGKNSNRHYIQVLENTTLIAIKNSNLEKLYKKYHAFERIGRLMVTESLIRLQERVIALQFYSAKERYELLLQQNPEIIKKVALTHIASYLGITLETLSRVRSQ